MHFRHQSQKAAALHDRSAIIQRCTVGNRQPDKNDRVKLCGFVQQKGKGVFRFPQQRGLQEKITAGVARDAKLRKHQDRRVR